MVKNMIQDGKKAVLLLENGTELIGKSCGAEGTAMGETVFTTAMVGYQETLTDSAFYGKLVTQTFPLIGNYGVNSFDDEAPAVMRPAISSGNGARYRLISAQKATSTIT